MTTRGQVGRSLILRTKCAAAPASTDEYLDELPFRFGFKGWSSSVVSLTTDFIDQSDESKRFTVGVTAIVRITLRDGVWHEDIGYGMLENSKSKGAALDKVSVVFCVQYSGA